MKKLLFALCVVLSVARPSRAADEHQLAQRLVPVAASLWNAGLEEPAPVYKRFDGYSDFEVMVAEDHVYIYGIVSPWPAGYKNTIFMIAVEPKFLAQAGIGVIARDGKLIVADLREDNGEIAAGVFGRAVKEAAARAASVEKAKKAAASAADVLRG
jgi:hypothetical protein